MIKRIAAIACIAASTFEHPMQQLPEE